MYKEKEFYSGLLKIEQDHQKKIMFFNYCYYLLISFLTVLSVSYGIDAYKKINVGDCDFYKHALNCLIMVTCLLFNIAGLIFNNKNRKQSEKTIEFHKRMISEYESDL